MYGTNRGESLGLALAANSRKLQANQNELKLLRQSIDILTLTQLAQLNPKQMANFELLMDDFQEAENSESKEN